MKAKHRARALTVANTGANITNRVHALIRRLFIEVGIGVPLWMQCRC